MTTRDPAVVALLESGETWTEEQVRDLYFLGSIETGTNEHARIAACAPELARWLLSTEYYQYVDSCYCHACRVDVSKKRHRADCAWLTLARKLGVR